MEPFAEKKTKKKPPPLQRHGVENYRSLIETPFLFGL
jgi:hypothetical protein